MPAIEVAGKPKRERVPNMGAEPIRLPLSAEPDDLLMRDLGRNELVSNYCKRVEAVGTSLILFPSKTGRNHPAAMLTAIKARIDTTNNTRAQLEERAESEAAAKEAGEAWRERTDAELDKWFDELQKYKGP